MNVSVLIGIIHVVAKNNCTISESLRNYMQSLNENYILHCETQIMDRYVSKVQAL